MKKLAIIVILIAALLACACSAPAPSQGGRNDSANMAAGSRAVGTSAPAADEAGNGSTQYEPYKAEQYDGSSAAVPAPEFDGLSDYSVYGEGYASIYELDFASPLDHPLSTFSADVDTAAYTNVRRRIENGQGVDRDMVRTEEMINYFHYDYPSPIGESPIAITTELSQCPWNPSNQLALVGLKAVEIDSKDLPASNLVFLIDVSGSMSDENKLPLVKRAFSLLIDQLTSRDRVSIVTYASSDAVTLYGARGDEKAAIQRAIEDLSAGGSTHASKGIETAYAIAREHFVSGGNNRIILATDGDFNVGVTSESELQRMIEGERDGGVYLTVLGFGMGNYQDSKVATLAKHGNGNYAYVDNLQSARKVLVEELGATLNTVAKDVKLQVEFNPQNVSSYRLIGYEHRMLRDEDFTDDAKDAGDIGSGHTVTALYEIVPNGEGNGSVAALKYQPDARATSAPAEGLSGEMLTVKVRYKDPAGGASKEIASVLQMESYRQLPSDNLRLAGAVAEFSLMLRDSRYMGNASAAHVLDSLRPLLLTDEYGYVRDLQSVVQAYSR